MRPRPASLVLPIAVALLASKVDPRGASAASEDPFDVVSVRLQAARADFESALSTPPDELDVADATRRFDEALLELRWELESLRERGLPADPAAGHPGVGSRGAWCLLLQSSADELDLSRARLREVSSVAPQVRALARLHVEMRTLLESDRPAAAIRRFEARLPEPLDPLDWPAVVRRRLRDVERLARTARAAVGPSARAEIASDTRPR